MTSTRLLTAGMILTVGWATPAPAGQAAATAPAGHVRAELLVTTEWLAGHLNDPNVVIVHVSRSRPIYENGHVPGARLLMGSEIARERDGVLNELPPVDDLVAIVQRLGIDEGKRIVLYDDSDGTLAARTFVTFDYLGLGGQTAVLNGQWPQWRAEKRPVSTEEVKPTPSSWRPKQLHPEIMVCLAEMRKLAAARSREEGPEAVPILDARSLDEYCGAVRGDAVTRPGHIPGAVSVPASQSIVAPDLPVLRPLPELRRTFEAAGLKPGGDVVVYCRTGMSASQDYFLSRYLGYNPRLYDGSYSQWNRQQDTQVAISMGTLQVRVTEKGGDPPLPCRAWVQRGGEHIFRPATQGCFVYDRDRSFSCDGEFVIRVPAGKLTVHVERGKEYFPVDRPVEVAADATLNVAIELERWVDMAAQGWYSADFHVHFGVKDPRVLRQLTVADDVNLVPVLGLWNENQPEWPFATDEAVLGVSDRYLVTRQNQEIERIGGGPFESIGAPLMYGLAKPVYSQRLDKTYPPDAVLVRQAKANSPGCLVDTDKVMWGENVVTAALGLFDMAQVCHNHYNRGRTVSVGWGMIGTSIEDEQREWGEDELFIRTNTVYYRWLNCGFRIAVSGGSAIGVMRSPAGHSRTYAKLDGPLTEAAYLAAVHAGQTFATCGPMLTMTVDGQPMGSTIEWKSGTDRSLPVVVDLQSIQSIDAIEIVQNGEVIRRVDLTGRQPAPVLKERVEMTVRPQRSGWLAARALFKEGAPNNPRQAHTSPVYVDVDGKPTASKRDAAFMIRWIDELMKVSSRPERYKSDADRQEVQALYRQARSVYQGIGQTAVRTWGD
ncbi:MAG: sulfurtransferase [Planctomycetes bacterium]|nr:sulfurtransferase [Planctomycetota bacterium]